MGQVIPLSVGAVFPQTAPADPFMAAMVTADIADGHTLEKDKELLCGMPFVITAVVFREGTKRPDKTRTNYVSAEIIIANEATMANAIKRGRIKSEQAQAYRPTETVVINDGSSGISRQLVAYCVGKGYIVVPDGPENGPVGESRYDSLRDGWTFPDGRAIVTEDENGHPVIRIPISLFCERGLRKSDYEHEDHGDVTTYYIG